MLLDAEIMRLYPSPSVQFIEDTTLNQILASWGDRAQHQHTRVHELGQRAIGRPYVTCRRRHLGRGGDQWSDLCDEEEEMKAVLTR